MDWDSHRTTGTRSTFICRNDSGAVTNQTSHHQSWGKVRMSEWKRSWMASQHCRINLKNKLKNDTGEIKVNIYVFSKIIFFTGQYNWALSNFIWASMILLYTPIPQCKCWMLYQWWIIYDCSSCWIHMDSQSACHTWMWDPQHSIGNRWKKCRSAKIFFERKQSS